ncbi:2-dehydropantoate 2-reductase [Dermabacteraceae bacterium TAE3-ERU27]|nr:2-dehydropantoate 2-reductase [Dermabacteraceae bacterium TAE3-ERU27]
MKIGIAGAGALGSRFGYMLSQAGYDVTLIDMWDDHVTAIRENGLLIDWNGEARNARLPIFYPHELEGSFDLVCCFTKAMGLDAMLSAIRHTLSAETSLLCLLNGIGHEETALKYVPADNFMLGNTIWTASMTGPGSVVLHGTGSVALENAGGDEAARERAMEVARVLSDAGLNAQYSPGVVYATYRKAALNGVVNTMCALLECNIATFGETSSAEAILRQIVTEFADVAACEGVELDREEVVAHVRGTFSRDSIGEHYPSMYQDLVRNNRRTEVDYITGAVSRKGKQYGVPTPFCDLVTLLVHAKEEIRDAA